MEVREGNVVAILRERALVHPDRVALLWPPGSGSGAWEEVTYRALATAAEGLARSFSDAGLMPGDRVLLLTPMSPTLYRVLLGLLWMGAVPVAVDPSMGLGGLMDVARRGVLRAGVGVWSTSWLLSTLPNLERRFLLGGGGRLLGFDLSNPAGSGARGIQAVAPGHPALVTFTSGSTGAPKGIVRSHGFLLAQREILNGHMGIREHDVDLSALPVFVLNSLAAGATCLLPRQRGQGRYQPGAMVSWLRRVGVTTMSGPPGFFEPLVDHCSARGLTLPTVRKAFLGGAFVGPDLLAGLDRILPSGEVGVVYGSSEAEPISGISGEEAMVLGREGMVTGKGMCVGRPVRGCEVAVIPPSVQPVPPLEGPMSDLALAPGGVGEVVVAGPHVHPEYVQEEHHLATSVLEPGGKLWHRTGDLGWLDGVGRLWLVGRLKDRIMGPRPLDTLEVEGPVAALPFVRRCAAIPAGPRGERLVVVVEPRAGWTRWPTELVAWRRAVVDRLGVQGIHPDAVVFLPRLPLDGRHRSRVLRSTLRRWTETCPTWAGWWGRAHGAGQRRSSGPGQVDSSDTASTSRP